MRYATVLVALLIASAAWSQAADDASPADIVGHCAESVDEDSLGVDELDAECPGLIQALEESGYLALLTAEQREGLQPHELYDLQLLVDRYSQPTPGTAADVAALKPILASLSEPRVERALTWLERFKRWLRALVERQQQEGESQLLRWLDGVRISDAAKIIIVYGTAILVVVLALGVVIAELRAAGVFRRARTVTNARGATRSDGVVATDASDPDLDAVAPEEQAPLLLRMLVATLVSSGRLRTERSLTHGELCRRAAFDNAEQRACFQRVAQLAERVVYGAGTIPPEQLEPVVADGRALIVQLGGAGA